MPVYRISSRVWLGVAVGRLWGHLDRFPPRRLVVAQERPGTLGGGLDVVAGRGEAAPKGGGSAVGERGRLRKCVFE